MTISEVTEKGNGHSNNKTASNEVLATFLEQMWQKPLSLPETLSKLRGLMLVPTSA